MKICDDRLDIIYKKIVWKYQEYFLKKVGNIVQTYNNFQKTKTIFIITYYLTFVKRLNVIYLYISQKS